MNSCGICQCPVRQFSTKLRKDLRELGLASFLSLTAVVFLPTTLCLLPIAMKKASVVVRRKGDHRSPLAEPEAQGLLPEPAPWTNLHTFLPMRRTHRTKQPAEQRVCCLLDLKPSSLGVYKSDMSRAPKQLWEKQNQTHPWSAQADQILPTALKQDSAEG